MASFLKIFLLFIYFLTAFFIKPCEVFAYSLNNNYLHSEKIFLKAQTEIYKFEETEKFYAVLQNNNYTQYSNNNKSNISNVSANNELISSNSKFNIYTYDNNQANYNYREYNTFLNLKYVINTRAP